MIKKFLKYLVLMCLILVFLSSFFYVQKYKNDRFMQIINQPIELKLGNKYEFTYKHGLRPELLEYEPYIQCICPSINAGEYKYNFKVKIVITKNSKILISNIYEQNQTYDYKMLNWTQFRISGPYTVLPQDKSIYKITIEVLDSNINLPIYKNLLGITLNADSYAIWNNIWFGLLIKRFLMWLSGIILLIYVFKILLQRFKKRKTEKN